MTAAVITVAGVSSRFNQGMEEDQKYLKAVYTEGSPKETLLFHLLENCRYMDHIIVVGGYQYDRLKHYIELVLPENLKSRIMLLKNDHYEDFGSGYSLWLGLQAVFGLADISEVIFAEGDLDMDESSFHAVADSDRTVLTYNDEPIRADKAVVFYQNEAGQYRYAFDCSHGFLRIRDAFSCIYNSGQLWKFTDMEILQTVSRQFGETDQRGTNLMLIQEYCNRISQNEIRLTRLYGWTNCNTREDYRRIVRRWRNENTAGEDAES